MTDHFDFVLYGAEWAKKVLLINKFDKDKFYVDKNNRLEDLNIDYTYSHV